MRLLVNVIRFCEILKRKRQHAVIPAKLYYVCTAGITYWRREIAEWWLYYVVHGMNTYYIIMADKHAREKPYETFLFNSPTRVYIILIRRLWTPSKTAAACALNSYRKTRFHNTVRVIVRILYGFFRKTLFHGRVYIKFVLWISVFSYGIIMLYCLIRIILGRQMMRAQANNILSVLGNNASV